MKIGVSIKIDVSKIDKARLFQGAKGTYLDLTTFIDIDQLDQYDNNGFISQSVSKEERENRVQAPILGNVKVFYNDSQQQQARQQPQHTQQGFQAPQDAGVKPNLHQQGTDEFESEIPF
jgi:hypothetical protein